MTAIAPGLFLRRRREAHGLSREDLALRLETSPPVSARSRAEHLAALEDGVQPITINDALALQRELHFDWHVLLVLSAIAIGHADARELPALCRVCACSEHDPCEDVVLGSCAWKEPDLCTACARAARAARAAA